MTSTEDVASYERLANDVYVYGSVALALAMARETKMIECLCTAERSLTSEDIASQLKLKERYARETLNSLTVAGLVQLEAGTGGPDGQEARYWVPPTFRQALRKAGVNCIMVSSSAKQYAAIRKCFDKDGPNYVDSTEDMDECYDELEEWGLAHLDCMTEKILETPGLKERLEKGLNALDVGCGTGLMFLHLAAMFPNSHFTLTDLEPQALETARKRAEEKGVKNVSFRQLDVYQMPDEFEEKFDWLLTCDVIQHLPQLLDALKGICKVLKPGGHYSLVDVFMSNHVAENVKSCKHAAAMYALNLFYGFPEGHQHSDTEHSGADCHHSHSEATASCHHSDSEATATCHHSDSESCWGSEKATELVEKAGMKVLKLARSEALNGMVVCMCQKVE